MFTFRPIESAASIIEYHRDSLVGYYSGSRGADGNARWIGRLREHLLPQSEVGREPTERSFARLLRNKSPLDGTQLTPRTRKKRRSGFDFACCAPKSVSMAHVMRGDDVILKIHRQCADEAFKFLEQFAAARIRRGGKYEDRRTENLVAFATEHASSRCGDPHLHTHFVVPNVTWDSEERRYKALQTLEIARNLALATAIYRNRLGMELIRLGYSLEDGADGKFEIKGVPAEVIREYSKGKERIDGKISDIENTLGHELEEAERRKIALGLRPKKMSKGEESAAFDKFRRHMKTLGLGSVFRPNILRALQNRLIEPSVSPKDAVNYAADHLFERSSVVSKYAFLKCAIERLGATVSYKKIFEEFGERISSHTFLEWGDGITTSEMLALEQGLVFMANDGMGKSESFLKMGGALWDFPKSMDDEQRKCLEQIMRSSDWLMNVQGVAGAGKSFMLRTLAANLNRQGIGFVAVAPSSKATAELHELGPENVQTMQSLIMQGGNDRLRKGLLIVDEAGLVGVRDMEKLFGIAKKYGARILFSGDIRQHKSVPAGDALRLLQTKSEMKTFSLKEIRRQRDEKYRSAVRAIFNGDVNETVFRLKKINAIVESSSPLRHSHEVAEEYIRAQLKGEKNLIVSPLWSEIEDISSAIRKRLFAMRHLDIGKSRQFCVAKSLSLTRAQRKNPQSYDRRGLYIEVFGQIAGVEPGIYRVANPQSEYEDNEGMQNGFAFAMLKECYPEEEDFDSAKRRFFCADGKTAGDVYGYFRKLYDDAKNPSQEVSGYWNTSEDSVEAKYSPERENDIIKSNKWLSFQHLTKSLPTEIRDMAFGMVFAEGSRADVAQAYVDRLLSMPEKDRNAALWGAYVLNPEVSANFFMRVGTRILENLGDNGFNISNYWEASQKGVNPNTIYDAVTELGAMDENGEIIPEKLPELNKRLNALRAENSIFNDESSQVYAEKIRNAVRRNRWAADHKEYGADFIREEYEKGRRYKEVFKLVSQLRDIRRTKFDRSESWVPETVEDATVVGVDMLKYVAASSIGTLATKNPWGSFATVGAVMYSEFKPQMFNALRHEGNMSVEDANRYANFATSGMIAANYIGYTNWVKALKPSSYLLGADIAKGSARDYFFHALKEVPKGFVRRGGTETASEYMESVVDLATKYWAMEHEGATFEERELWDDFCRDFRDTTRIMPTLMLGSTLIGGGLALNRVRTDSGVGWDLRQLVAPADVVSHNVQMRMAMAQAQKAADDAANVFGSGGAYDFFAEYSRAAGDGERSALLAERFSDEGEREAAKAVLDNIDRIDREAGNAFGRILADAARMNAEETRRLDAAAQKIEEFQDGAQDGPSPRFAMVDALAQRLGMRESVVFLDTQSDIEALGFSPEAAAETMENLDKKGFFNSDDGKIYMLSGHFKNGVDAFRTFVHENGHRVADAMRASPEFSGMLRRVEELAGGEENLRAMLPGSYQNEKVQTLAEEYLMRVVERVALEQTVNARQRGVWAFFKERLRKWFGGETFASAADREIAEIARDILRRAESPASETGAEPSRWSAVTPENNGKRAGGVWAVVDADSLVTSTDEGYDDKLQPRNRTRRASTEQTADIAMHLDPDRLGDSTTTDDGAPIVDARGMVISGNGRTLAIRRAYDSEDAGRAEAYKAAVFERASSMGLEVPQDAKRPVLVRVVDDLGGMTLEDFAARSNKSKIAKMSNAETAVNDARRILDANLLEIFFPSDSGDVLAAGNRDFITAFLETVGGREEYIDKNGNLKSNLAPRIRAAVLAAMLNPEKREIIEELLDNPQGWNSLINGLMGCSAKLAKLSGNPEYDISAELSAAVEAYVQVVRGGENVETFVGQQDFTRPELPGESVFLMDLFEKNARTPSGISGVLNAYYDLAKNIDTSTQDMFGAENPSKIDVLRNAYKKYATTLTEEPKVSWRDTGEAFVEKTLEAQKQYDEVLTKYRGTPQWMKAPNGKPTKLTERQWVLVRTPNFKKWFGDWEKQAWANAAMDFLENTAPVKELSGKEFQKDGTKLTDKVSAFFNSIGNKAHNSELGDVVLDSKGVQDSLGHGIGSLKAAAFAAVKDVIENGFIFSRETNWKNRKWNSAVIVAPISIADSEYICEVVVAQKPQGNKFYLHEVEIKETLGDLFKTAPKNAANLQASRTLDGVFKSVANNGNASRVSRLILGKHLAEVKGNVSQVVDENGEPLVVYHRSQDSFNVFDRGKIGSASDWGALGRGFYFSPRDMIQYGGVKYSVFLNIKNPMILDRDNAGAIRDEVDADRGESFTKRIVEQGYDGVIYKDWEGIDEIVALESPQIKEAANRQELDFGKGMLDVPDTDNVGAFDAGNPDIRWRIDEGDATRFRGELQNYIDGKLDDRHIFKIGTTPEVMRLVGVDDLPIEMQAGVLARKNEKHGLVLEDLANLPYELANPIAITQSATVPDGIVVITELPTIAGNTVVVAVHLNKKIGRIEVNSIRSIYYKRNGEIQNWADRGEFLYINTQKKPAWLKSPLLQLRGRDKSKQGFYARKILTKADLSQAEKDSFPRLKSENGGGIKELLRQDRTENPDMRWRIDDADISDISAKVEKIIDSVSDKKNRHIEVLRKVSDAEADFLLEKTGLDLKGYSHSIDNYSILHILKKHGSKKELQRGQIPVTVEDIRNFPIIVSDYDDVEYVGKSNIGRDTIRFEKSIDGNNVLVFEEMRVGKKLLALSTMYIQKKKKLTSNANASSNTSETLSTSSSFKETENGIENQENNSQLRFLLRQDRTENPVIWASIVLSKEILNGRGITRAKLEKVLPSERFDGAKQNYAIDRAKRIAEKTRLTQGGFAEDLDRAIRKAESDLFWQEEFVENAYRAFSRGGEEYGFAKAKIMQYLKDLKNRELPGCVKGGKELFGRLILHAYAPILRFRAYIGYGERLSGCFRRL